jgi:hypothetical protein
MTPATRGFIFTALFIAFLFGDLMYETTLLTDNPTGTEITARNFYKVDRSRIENCIRNSSGASASVIVITRLDQKVIWVLDPQRKTYTEQRLLDTLMSGEVSKPSSPKPEIAIQKTGQTQKIIDRSCEEVTCAMNTVAEPESISVNQTLWLAADIPGYQDLFEYNMKMREAGISPWYGIKTFDEPWFRHFLDQVSNIYGFPMSWTMTARYNSTANRYSIKIDYSVTKYACAPIMDNVFEIPANYLLVPVRK